jgi:O-antigen/teichoic acid export membrane protein
VTARDPLAGAASHGLWTLLATFIPGAYGLAVAAYLLHTLPADHYALWATGLALVGWLTLLDAGLASTIVREAARSLVGDDGARVRVQAANSVYQGLGVIALCIGTGVSLVLPALIGAEGTPFEIGTVVASLLVADFAVVLGTAAWTGLLRGARRFDLLVLVNVVQVAIAVPLFILLLPPLGLVGAAAAQLGGRLAARVVLAFLVRRQVDWFDLRPRKTTRKDFVSLMSFTLPILGTQVATQLGMGTDVFIVGAVWGATSVGMYASGSQLIRYVGQFLFPAVNVVLPAFSSADYVDARGAPDLLTRTLLPVTAIGVAVFLGIAANAHAVMELWAGEVTALGTGVLIAHALVFTLIAPAHLMTLMLVARGQHAAIGAVVFAESVVNLCLSIVLVNAIGPIGPAISTFVVIGADDLVVIPLLASSRLRIRPLAIWAKIAAGYLVGGAIVGASLLIPVADPLHVVARVGFEAVLLAGFLWYALNRRNGGLNASKAKPKSSRVESDRSL